MSKPNVIVFISDSWDGRQLACLGNTLALKTPNADRLAEQGVNFTQTYCNAPLCSPSRASLWSGRYPHKIGAWNNYKGIGPESSTFSGAKTELINQVPRHPTLMGDLFEAGWRTNMVGTLDFTDGNHSIGARLSAWLRCSGLPLPVLSGPRLDVKGEGKRANESDWQFIDAAGEWMKKQTAPFFLSVGVRCPHPYRTTSQYWLDQIDPALIKLPVFEEEAHPVSEYKRRARKCDRQFSREEIIFLRRRYYAMIAEADAMLGELMDYIDESGLADNTYLVFAGDHGEMNMEHNLVFKSSFYEPSARVPLIIRGPGLGQGKVVDTPVSLVDIYPTVMELAGVSRREELDGQSLAPVLSDNSATDATALRDHVFSEYHGNDMVCSGFMLRQDKWKYIAYDGYPSQLFDLENDPEELENLAAVYPDKAAELHEKLERIVDTRAIARQAAAEDREAFKKWRAGVSEEEYHEQMEKLFGKWDAEQEKIVRDWLDNN